MPVPERLTRASELITERLGITLRPLRMKDFNAEVERVKELYNKAWEHNWGFVPMTDHEIDHLAAQFKPVVVPDLVPFVEKDGKVIALRAGAARSQHRASRPTAPAGSSRSSSKLLWSLKTKPDPPARIILLGVLPEYRGKGIDAVLYHWIWTRGGNAGLQLGRSRLDPGGQSGDECRAWSRWASRSTRPTGCSTAPL